jgi:hypothetical protein
MKQPYQLSHRELGTSLTAADLRRLLPQIITAEPALHDCWMVDDAARTLAVHGLDLHGSIHFIHYAWEGKLYLTIEFRQGDQAKVMRVIEELAISGDGEKELSLWPKADKIPVRASSGVAGFLQELRKEPFKDHLIVTGSAIESARECTWEGDDILLEELFLLTEIPALLKNGGLNAAMHQARIEQLCRVWPEPKMISFRGRKLALGRRMYVPHPEFDNVLCLHFAFDAASGKHVIGYVEEEAMN